MEDLREPGVRTGGDPFSVRGFRHRVTVGNGTTQYELLVRELAE